MTKQIHGRVRGALVQRGLADSVARLAAAEHEAHTKRLDLERKLGASGDKIKGTRDVTGEARAVTEAEAKIEVALRGADAPMRMFELVRATGLPVMTVVDTMRHLRARPCMDRSDQAPDAMQVFNHGFSEDPAWGWVVGDKTTTRELYAEIERMLRRRPYTFVELTNATGARRGRIGGATVEFSRSGLPIYNLSGNHRHYRWFIGDPYKLPRDEREVVEPVRLDPDKTKL